ncbi:MULTISPECIES: (2,3-dihydroxybenzoyl)adenylate synthase [Gordonia]|uniref:(2,3-dihydroxybenzoyl)adenylate synthase n=1 Tax=Gordonia TaxID=2053 RepID=UPI0007EB2656|nr:MULTISPECIES: AMP-binding protein [Gordonia]OBC09676.1 2,3-dihydroxybenzoate-AMP ligase [Gordonia sp. 852002-50395_SCH5434458]
MLVSPWPPELEAKYRADGLWVGETFDDVLRSRAADPASADHTAVVDIHRRLSYAELDDRVGRVAAGMVELGIAPDDRVLVQIPNRVCYVEAVFALFRLRAIPVFTLPAHRAGELVGIARAAGATTIISPREDSGFDYRGLADTIAAQVDSITRWIDADDLDALSTEPIEHDRANPAELAFLQLSGGSTGIPKLIPRTHDDYLYSVRRSNELCGVTADTVYLATLPVAHNFPMSSPGILGAMCAGGTIALTASPAPSVAWEMVAREGVTMTGLVPPLARLWTETAEAGTSFDLSSLDVIQVGGARCPDELARRIGPALGVRLQQVFGMAEGLVCYTRLDDPIDVITTTQGRPMSADDQIRLVDEDGVDVGSGPGFLETQGPYTIRSYWQNASASSFASDGWYRTGDVVELTADGNVVVRGRGGDRVNRGGEKVSAEQLEEQLLTHPAVRDAIVVAVADPYLGERTCAYLIPDDADNPPNLAGIRRFVRENGLAEWKLPDVVKIIDEFPETGVGKVSRKKLREILAG